MQEGDQFQRLNSSKLCVRRESKDSWEGISLLPVLFLLCKWKFVITRKLVRNSRKKRFTFHLDLIINLIKNSGIVHFYSFKYLLSF